MVWEKSVCSDLHGLFSLFDGDRVVDGDRLILFAVM